MAKSKTLVEPSLVGRLPPMIDADLLDASSWKAPSLDRERRGDPDVDAIYHAVGQALSGWEQLEDAFGTLFAVLLKVDGGSWLAAARTFGAVMSSGSRREMITEVARVYFAHWWDREPVRGPLKALIEATSAASRRRDEIAHGIAMHYIVNTEDVGAFLMSSNYVNAKNSIYAAIKDDIEKDVIPFSTSIYRYTAEDIKKLACRFAAMHMYVKLYSGAIQIEGGIPKNVQAFILRGCI